LLLLKIKFAVTGVFVFIRDSSKSAGKYQQPKLGGTAGDLSLSSQARGGQFELPCLGRELFFETTKGLMNLKN
jgi:hypothetical protein